MKSFHEYYDERVNESKSFLGKIGDKIGDMVSKVDRWGAKEIRKTYYAKCPIHCEDLTNEDDGFVCQTCNKPYSRSEAYKAYLDCRKGKHEKDIVEHDSQTMMDMYGQLAYGILSKKIGFRAGGYMQRMFSDSEFIKELVDMWKGQFGVARSSDLEPIIEKYFKSHPV